MTPTQPRRGGGTRSLFYIPRTGHQVLWFTIAWVVILFIVGSIGYAIVATIIGS